MATAADLINQALSRLAILRMGSVANAAQLASGLQALNNLVTSWYADGVQIDLSQPFPVQHEKGIIALLAMDIAPTYGAAAIVSPGLAKDARDGWERLLAEYIFSPRANIDSGLRNMPSQRIPWQYGAGFPVSSTTRGAPSVIGFCTLTAGSPTTVVVDLNCLLTSTVTLTPATAAAQVEFENPETLPSVAVGPVSGEFTITHVNNAITDRSFEYLITI